MSKSSSLGNPTVIIVSYEVSTCKAIGGVDSFVVDWQSVIRSKQSSEQIVALWQMCSEASGSSGEESRFCRIDGSKGAAFSP